MPWCRRTMVVSIGPQQNSVALLLRYGLNAGEFAKPWTSNPGGPPRSTTDAQSGGAPAPRWPGGPGQRCRCRGSRRQGEVALRAVRDLEPSPWRGAVGLGNASAMSGQEMRRAGSQSSAMSIAWASTRRRVQLDGKVLVGGCFARHQRRRAGSLPFAQQR